MDHKSVIVPREDSIHVRAEIAEVKRLREEEVAALARKNLVDAWRLVHDGPDHEPPHWTFGWEGQGDTRNSKQLNRVHLQQAMVENASGAYTVLTGADHKGVVVQLAPPAMLTGRLRQRFPTELLQDTAAVAALRDRVQAVQGASDEEWWTETMSVIGEVGNSGGCPIQPGDILL